MVFRTIVYNAEPQCVRAPYLPACVVLLQEQSERDADEDFFVQKADPEQLPWLQVDLTTGYGVVTVFEGSRCA